MKSEAAFGAVASLLAALLAACAPSPEPSPDFDPNTVPEAYLHSSAALMVPGATRAFWITPRGDFYNGSWDVLLRPTVDGDTASLPETIAFEDRWLPVAHWRRANAGVRWSFEAVAFAPTSSDTGLFASVLVRVTNTSTSSRDARLALLLAHRSSTHAYIAFDARGREPALTWSNGSSRDTVLGWSGGAIDGGRTEFQWTLAPGESQSARVVLATYPVPARIIAGWSARSHEEIAQQVRRYWLGEVSRGAQFTLHDDEVENALRAARVLLLSLRERRGPLWVPIGGPFHYRDVWLRDGARAVYALSLSGHTTAARELARGLLEYQWPSGALLSQRGQLDGTGQALWAFEQSMLRPEPDESTEDYARAALRAVRWVEWQRKLGRDTGWPYGTMLPHGDPRDAELVRAQLVGNDAWAIAGYRSAERLLRAAGLDMQADSVERARAAYVEDFSAALGRTGHSGIPPAWQPGGRDWGNVAVPWPTGALAPGDPRCEAMARRLWAQAGGAGLVSYGPPDSAHYYLGADLGVWALHAGLRAEADSVLDELLYWRSASGTACEIFSRSSGDFGANLPPHPTSAAALIALVRSALIDDDGDTLRLTLGARQRWWRDGRVEAAPTRWGTLDVSFRSDGTTATWEWTPVPVWTVLTVPPGHVLSGVPPAPLLPGARPDVLVAPPHTSSAHVMIEPHPGVGS